MEFCEILTELLEDRDIQQKDLANQLKLTPSAVTNYVHGLREPEYKVLKQIAQCLDVSTDYLLDNHTSEFSLTHQEQRLLELYRSMDTHTQELFIEQGIFFVQRSKKENDKEV